MPDLTPEQLKQALQNAVAEVEANMGNILFNAANVGASQMQFRVFNKGITTSGKRMEYRNAPSNYTNLRLDAGLSISVKDLTFTGNLFNSLTILSKSNEQVSYGFNNAEMATIRTYQETSDKQVNEPIFDLNEKEEMAMYKAIGKDLRDLIIRTITNFPNKPAKVAMEGKDAVSKSVARQQKLKAKRKKYARKEALKKKAKEDKIKLAKRQTRTEILQKSINKTNLKSSELIKKKQSAEKALKSNQFRRIDTSKRAEYLQGVIKRKQAYADANAVKLAKSRTGSKAGKEYARKLAQQRKEISLAKQALSEVKQVKQLKKTISDSSKQLQKSRSQYKTQSAKMKSSQKKLTKKQRIKKVELRAKQIRMGTYKPKKRKKK